MQPPRGRDRNWPTVVLEVAVSESQSKIQSDVRFWSWKSQDKVSLVFTLTVDRQNPRIVIEKWEPAGDREHRTLQTHATGISTGGHYGSRMLPSCTDHLAAKLILKYMNEVLEALRLLPWHFTRSAGPTRRFGQDFTSDSITKGPSGKRGIIAQMVLALWARLRQYQRNTLPQSEMATSSTNHDGLGQVGQVGLISPLTYCVNGFITEYQSILTSNHQSIDKSLSITIYRSIQACTLRRVG